MADRKSPASGLPASLAERYILLGGRPRVHCIIPVDLDRRPAFPSQKWEAAVPQAGSFRQQLFGDLFKQLLFNRLHYYCASGTPYANQGQSSPMILPVLTLCAASTSPAGSLIIVGNPINRPVIKPESLPLS
jgi:hypothetical protein